LEGSEVGYPYPYPHKPLVYTPAGLKTLGNHYGQLIHFYHSGLFPYFIGSNSLLAVTQVPMNLKSWMLFMFGRNKSTCMGAQYQRGLTPFLSGVKLNEAHIVSQTCCTFSIKTNCSSGYQVAQIRVVFQIPSKVQQEVFPLLMTTSPIPTLAYVEWFSYIPASPDPHHLMYKVSRLMRNGRRHASIIPVGTIIGSVHLFPQCRPATPPEWNSFTVLETCQHFYLNPFSDRDIYLILARTAR
jgi:hypothetical protein